MRRQKGVAFSLRLCYNTHTSCRVRISVIQRKLDIGYGRAAQLIDKMEELGVVSQADGAKPRKVLMSKDDVMEKIIK